jgi:hypothetical protein
MTGTGNVFQNSAGFRRWGTLSGPSSAGTKPREGQVAGRATRRGLALPVQTLASFNALLRRPSVDRHAREQPFGTGEALP